MFIEVSAVAPSSLKGSKRQRRWVEAEMHFLAIRRVEKFVHLREL